MSGTGGPISSWPASELTDAPMNLIEPHAPMKPLLALHQRNSGRDYCSCRTVRAGPNDCACSGGGGGPCCVPPSQWQGIATCSAHANTCSTHVHVHLAGQCDTGDGCIRQAHAAAPAPALPWRPDSVVLSTACSGARGRWQHRTAAQRHSTERCMAGPCVPLAAQRRSAGDLSLQRPHHRPAQYHTAAACRALH